MDFVIQLMIDIFLTALGLYICFFEEMNQIVIAILLGTSNVLYILQYFKAFDKFRVYTLFLSFIGKYIAIWLLNKQFMWQVLGCQLLLVKLEQVFILQTISVALNIFDRDGLNSKNAVVLSLQFLIVFVLLSWVCKQQKPPKEKEQVVIDLGSANRLKPDIELTPSQSPRYQLKKLFSQCNYIIFKENLEIVETNFELKCHLINDTITNKVYEQFLFVEITSSNFGESEQIYTLKEFMQKYADNLKNHFASFFINKSQFFDLENVTLNVFPFYENDCANYLLSFSYLSQSITHRLQEQENNQVLMDIGRSLSHELGTNLNSIIVFANLAMHDDDVPKYVKMKYLQPLQVNSEQLGLIVSNIRDYNLINLQQFNLKLEEFSVSEEVKYIESLISDVVHNKSINIQYEISNQSNIVNDRQRFRQVYFQFLHNAVKYTNQGTIRVRIETNRSQCQISIHDSGPGLSNEEMERLQNLISRNQFVKVSNHSVGSGLGLGISNSIIKRLNGRNIPIICDSKDKGTVFTFLVKNHIQEVSNYDVRRSLELKSSRSIIRLISGNSYIESPFTNSVKFIRPSQSIDSVHYRNSESDSICCKAPKGLMVPDQVSVPISEDEYVFIQEPRNLSPKFQYEIIECSIQSNCCSRVLIVDDEYFNILSLTLLMQKHKAKCDYAYNGREAISKIMQKLEMGCEICQNRFYCLIFIDINMPILDGYETVREIKTLIKNRIIRRAWCVANTGFTDLDTKMQSIKSGMDYFLTKPLDAKNLHELIVQMFPFHK